MIAVASRHGRWRVLLTALIALAVVGIDQLTKQWVLDRLGPEGDLAVVQIIPRVLRLYYVENTGAAFGFFRGNSSILTVLATVMIIFLLFYFRRAIARSTWLSLALGLQIGGAFGNIVDRLRHGFVVDFIDVPRFPTFNMADSAITVGVVILGVFLFVRDPHASTDSPGAEGPNGQHMAGDANSTIASGVEVRERS